MEELIKEYKDKIKSNKQLYKEFQEDGDNEMCSFVRIQNDYYKMFVTSMVRKLKSQQLCPSK